MSVNLGTWPRVFHETSGERVDITADVVEIRHRLDNLSLAVLRDGREVWPISLEVASPDVEMVGVVVPSDEWEELRAQVAEIHAALCARPSPNAPWPGWLASRAAREKRDA